MKGSTSESVNAKEVRALISSVYDETTIQDSVYEQAAYYFQQKDKVSAELQQYQLAIASLENKIKTSDKKNAAVFEKKLKVTLSTLKQFKTKQEKLRQLRYLSLKKCCEAILNFTEGCDFEETNKKTAKLLSTIQLILPAEGLQASASRARAKHIYKAVLCLRLLDRMLIDGQINHPYITEILDKSEGEISSMSVMNEGNSRFRTELQLPFLMASLLQDIGSCHPDAQAILCNANGTLDPYRRLSNIERSQLFKITYKESLDYLSEGIGLGHYIGNSKEEREQFYVLEQSKLEFTQALLTLWVKPKNGIGNLLKISDIYGSAVMSSKPTFNYKLLPRVFDILSKKANEGIYNKATVDSLLKITGKFPLGYGITYIPKDSEAKNMDRYEYAIVIGLYPEEPQTPICRAATKNLIFVTHGHNYNIGVENNLYYPDTRKKLEKIGKERLQEIEEQLSSNFKEKKKLDYIPHCWYPDEFFSLKKYQNLWNSSTLTNI